MQLIQQQINFLLRENSLQLNSRKNSKYNYPRRPSRSMDFRQWGLLGLHKNTLDQRDQQQCYSLPTKSILVRHQHLHRNRQGQLQAKHLSIQDQGLNQILRTIPLFRNLQNQSWCNTRLQQFR
jgi:hypothetical protein